MKPDRFMIMTWRWIIMLGWLHIISLSMGVVAKLIYSDDAIIANVFLLGLFYLINFVIYTVLIYFLIAFTFIKLWYLIDVCFLKWRESFINWLVVKDQ